MAEQTRFSTQRALGGAALGVVIGIIATMSGEPPWWWLAIPIGGVGGGFSSGDSSGSWDSGSPTWNSGGDSVDSSGGGNGGGDGGGGGGDGG